MRYADPVAQAEIDRLTALINEAMTCHYPEHRNGLTYCHTCSHTFWPCGTSVILTGNANPSEES